MLLLRCGYVISAPFCKHYDPGSCHRWDPFFADIFSSDRCDGIYNWAKVLKSAANHQLFFTDKDIRIWSFWSAIPIFWKVEKTLNKFHFSLQAIQEKFLLVVKSWKKPKLKCGSTSRKLFRNCDQLQSLKNSKISPTRMLALAFFQLFTTSKNFSWIASSEKWNLFKIFSTFQFFKKWESHFWYLLALANYKNFFRKKTKILSRGNTVPL